jgi:hypothetical protein
MKVWSVAATLLAFTASAALADGIGQTTTQLKPSRGVLMTDVEMAGITAGALVNVVAVDVVDANVAAVVQANVLGNAIQSGSAAAKNLNPVGVAGTLD